MSSREFYSHSGRIGPLGIPLGLLFGLVAAFVLGAIYAYAINWIPIVYVNLFLSLGVGFGVGIAVVFGSSLGKIRNPMVSRSIGFVAGVFALYVAWVFDVPARTENELELSWNPSDLVGWMQFGYENGFWSLGRGGGQNVTGIPLAIVWVIEGAMIVGLAPLVAVITDPFCEDCDAWTEERKQVASVLPPEGDEESLEILLDGDLSAVENMDRVTKETHPRIDINIHTCKTCDLSNYVSINLCTETVNDKGESTKNEESLVTHMWVEPDEIKRLIDSADLPPTRLEESGDDESPFDEEGD